MTEFEERYRANGSTKELTRDIVDERVPPGYSTDHNAYVNSKCEIGELSRKGDWDPPRYVAEFDGSIYEPAQVLWEIDDGTHFDQLWIKEITSDGRVVFGWFVPGE